MSRIASSEIDETLDIEYYVDREGIPYQKSRGSSGWQLNLRDCPSCGDRRYRTYLNAETGRGNCFVCNTTFNKLTFMKAQMGDAPWREVFAEAKQVLLEQGWRPRRMNTAAVEYEEAKLPESFALPTPEGENLIYLEERGITGAIAKYFHLRFCVEGWWNFTKDDGSRGGQKFDMRVIIPVFDLDGTFVTFQGRDVTGVSDRKYLFPKGLPGTGRYLFNGQNAYGAKRVVMGEGAFDVAAIKIALDDDPDLRDVVPIGSFGKDLSYGSIDGDDQLGRFIQLKQAGLREVVIMWDGEEKALVSAIKAAERLRAIGVKARVAFLPAGKDPNEVFPEVVREAFRRAEPCTPANIVKWRLRNPYAHSRRQQSPVSSDCTSASISL